MTEKLSCPQRRALEGLERGATLAATHPTVIAALRAKGLITEHDHGGRHEITDAGLARLHLRRAAQAWASAARGAGIHGASAGAAAGAAAMSARKPGSAAPTRTPGPAAGWQITRRCDRCLVHQSPVGFKRVGPLWVCQGCKGGSR